MTKFIIVHQHIKETRHGMMIDFVEVSDETQDIYVNVDEISGFRDGAIELKNGDRIDLLKEKAEEIMEKIDD